MTRRQRVAWLGAMFGAFVLDSAAAQDDQELKLEVGEQRTLPSLGVQSYSEGVPGIVDVRLTKEGSFVIVGQRTGRTSLLLMKSDGTQVQHRIEVVDRRTQQAADAPIRVAAKDNVRLDFYFVQLTRDGGLQAGMRWPASFGGGNATATFDLLGGSFTEATAMVTDQALPRLDLAQARGWAKVLRQSALITVNGSEASFAGGGEINVPVQGALSAGLHQIVFGTTVRVRPSYDRESGRIELAIHAEVSDLAPDHGSGLPGRLTSTLDSVVNLGLGQSLVLAGLTASSEGASSAGLPGLSQIPILGLLFGTHQQRSEHTENLVFIVPSVVEAVSLDARERIRGALRLLAEYDGDGEVHLRDPAAPLGPPARRRGAAP